MLDDYRYEYPARFLQPLARAFAVRGWQKALAQDLEGGVEDLMTAMRLGQRLIDASDPLVPGLIGVAIVNRTIPSLEAILDGPARTSRAAHEAALTALMELSTRPASAHRWVASECKYNEGIIMSLEDSKTRSLFGPVPQEFESQFDLGATVDRYRIRSQTQIEWARLPPSERPRTTNSSSAFQDCVRAARHWDDVHLCGDGPLDFPPLSIAENSPSNEYGIWLADRVSPPFFGYSYREDWMRTERVRLRVIWAARIYAMDHDGGLPDSVQALVPDYLPEPPTNPWDGSLVELVDGWVQVKWDRDQANYPVVGSAQTRWPIATP